MNTKLIKATSLLLFFTFGIVIIGCETQEQREKKREEKRTQKFVLQLNNRNQDIKTRVNAARALGRINTPTTQKELVSAIPMLIEALDNTDTSTRAFAASALGNIGKSAKKAIPNSVTIAKGKIFVLIKPNDSKLIKSIITFLRDF